MRNSLLRLTIAQGAGMKRQGGSAVELGDFLPDYCKKQIQESPELREAKLRNALTSLSKRQKSNG